MDERALWDAKAAEWARWIGDDGDETRRYLTDAVLWRFAGEVRGKRALDAGCGTGYLTLKLAARGARAVGVDYAPKMIEAAKKRAQQLGVRLDLRVDNCETLSTVPASSVDLYVSNFVLIDVQDLEAASVAMARVLAPGGRAVVVLVHPCMIRPEGKRYDVEQIVEERWGPFLTPFVHHHRPLSRYLGAFKAAGMQLDDLAEPMLSDPPPPELAPGRFERAKERPFALVLALQKAAR